MKKQQLIILILLVFLTSGSLYSQALNTPGTIRIYQNNIEITENKGLFRIFDKPFEIRIDDVESEDNIAIFAYPTDEMFTRYDYPIETSDTVIFAPGTGLAMSVEQDRSFYLRINREMTQNYFSSDRRIDIGNQSILKINGFTGTNHSDKKHNVYITIFIDFNKNRIIEENEIKNITIKVISSRFS